MLRNMLKRHKHKVTEAQSGAEFLQKMDRARPPLGPLGPLEALIEVCSQTDTPAAAAATVTVTTASTAAPGGQVSSTPAASTAAATELAAESVLVPINAKVILKSIKEEVGVESESAVGCQLERHPLHLLQDTTAAAELTAANVALLPSSGGALYDVILMDNHMPMMAGPEVTRYSFLF